MADEVKKEAEKTNVLGVLVKIVVGLALIALGLVAIVTWWSSVWTLIKGCVGAFLVLAGIIFLAIAKE